jgi:hypothetical protein
MAAAAAERKRADLTIDSPLRSPPRGSAGSVHIRLYQDSQAKKRPLARPHSTAAPDATPK